MGLAIIRCERCQRKQVDRVAGLDDEVLYFGCLSCGYPYARYVVPYAVAK